VASVGAAAHCWEDVLGPDERLAARGYAGPRQVRAGRCLLLVDLYNKAFGAGPAPLAEAVTSEPSSCGEAGWAALPVLQELLHTARRSDVPVAHTVGDSPASGRDGVLRTEHVAAGADPARSAWGNTIIEPLTPREGELVVAKARASAFFGTSLQSSLEALGVHSLVVAGESTSGCVRATVVDAFSLGFDVVVVEEATFDRSPLSHKVNLFDMHCKYATVVHADQAVPLLGDPADVMLEVS
jgi:maleamate amidohydrolase